jgi:hypothetical protein
MKLLVVALLVVLAHADIDAVFFERDLNAFWGNTTSDGDDTLVDFKGDLAGSEPKHLLFDGKSGFEVYGTCPGVCQRSSTSCGSAYKSGLCPGSSDFKCCPMSAPSCSGQCQDTSLSCSGEYQSGKCPGASNIKCCAASSSGGSSGSSSSYFPNSASARTGLYNAAMAIYNNRAHERYTQNAADRWIGIRNGVRPPNAPSMSDCSSSTTWAYWTVFGSGPDLLNGQRWAAGYTGSMSTRGRSISCSSMQSGDLAFYGHPISHVAISVGNGRVVSHGSDPAALYSTNYRSDLNQCRTYLA